MQIRKILKSPWLLKLIFIGTLLGAILIATKSNAQNGIYQRRTKTLDRLEALQTGKKLLYVSFLPGQENTKFLIAMHIKDHFTTGVFWMSRGEGMHNYNGPEKGIDLGVIHVAEMENAARLGGFIPFVSSIKDLGATDTATINLTISTDRLMLDLATVIRKFRPDILVVGHMQDTSLKAINTDPGFNDWMDSICKTACALASGHLKGQLDNKSLTPFEVSWVLADDSPILGANEQNTVEDDSLQSAGSTIIKKKGDIVINLNGMDSVAGKSFQQRAAESKQAYRSVYPDSSLALEAIPLRGGWSNKALLSQVQHLQMKGADKRQRDLDLLFANQVANDTHIGLWPRLTAEAKPQLDSKIDLEEIQVQLSHLHVLLLENKEVESKNILRTLLDSFRLYDREREGADPNNVDPDLKWIASQLKAIEHSLSRIDLWATADRELGVLGQTFRLKVSMQGNATVQWLLVPGLTDTIRFDTATSSGMNQVFQNKVILDSLLHIPLYKEAYQPFWLNKSMRSDGSYGVDTEMQGRLSDSTSFHVKARVFSGADTLLYQIPVYYRHFDRTEGQIIRPFYTIEPLLVSMTPTVLLTHVLRNNQTIGSKELHINIKTLFKDTSQVALFKIRQVGIQTVINGHKLQSDSASMVYQDAGFITPSPGAKMKTGIVLTGSMIKGLNPLTPILKPNILLKLPEGVQGFSSNIKSVGYPYQVPRMYNYHSQTMVVGDTIHTTGRQLLYVNGLTGDVYENAFNQLGYHVQNTGFGQLASWMQQVDLTSSHIPSMIEDSLHKLDAIVLSGADEQLPKDSVEKARLQYILAVYIRLGGRIINLDPDPGMQNLLPAKERIYSGMLIAINNSFNPIARHPHIDSAAGLFAVPNKVSAAYFKNWDGLLARSAVYLNVGGDMSGESVTKKNTVLTLRDSTPGNLKGTMVTMASVNLYPVWMSMPFANEARQVTKVNLAPVSIHYFAHNSATDRQSVTKQNPKNAILINCFLALGPDLSNGKPQAYKWLANLLAYPSNSTK